MVDALDPSRLDPTRGYPTDDDDLPVGRHEPPPAAPREVRELPDTDAALYAKAASAAKAGAPAARQPVFTKGIAVPDVERTPITPLQRRLDASFEAAHPTFQVRGAGGTLQEVRVATPFRMSDPLARDPSFARDNPGNPYVIQERVVALHTAALRAIARGVGLEGAVPRIQLGRGSLEEIRRVTQALLDEGRLVPPSAHHPDLERRIRATMTLYGVGIDCAGYVQRAFLASRQTTRAAAGLKADPVDEDLSGLDQRGFARVGSESLRAGDIVVLKSNEPHGVGHTAILRAVTRPSAEELDALAVKNPDTKKLDAAHLTRILVDSSWGAGADSNEGGVKREVWWHDDAGDRWMMERGHIAPFEAHSVYWHAFDGIYRPRSEP